MEVTAQDNMKRVKLFADECRGLGIKATHQRTEIYRQLVRTDEHPDAKTLYRRVRRRIPAISFDTVYRTLRLFEEKGVISRVGHQGESARFDANTDRHHHFICTKCGFVGDFYSKALDDLPTPRRVEDMGKVNSVHIELRGVCRTCQPKDSVK